MMHIDCLERMIEYQTLARKYPQINETTHNPYGDDDYNKLWEIEIENWQSTENIKEHWDRYKKLKHSFIYCDVCKNPDKVTKLIKPKANSVIWWSNVFHTVNAHYVRRLSELKNIYENNWIQKISCNSNGRHNIVELDSAGKCNISNTNKIIATHNLNTVFSDEKHNELMKELTNKIPSKLNINLSHNLPPK